MATSPTSVAQHPEQDPFLLSPKEFTAKLDQIVKHLNNLQKLGVKVNSLGKTQRLVYPNGQTVGRKELRTLYSQLGKEIKGLRKNYAAAHKKKKRKKRVGGSAGFKNPIKVTDNMREFFSNASLGPSVPGNPSSQALSQILAVGQNGITTRAIMTPLFNIYAHVNQMQKDPANKQFLTATAEMNQHFGPTYQRLAAKPQKFQKNKETGQPDLSKPIPKFDPNRFRYASIQSIVADNTVPKDQVSAEENIVLARLPVNKELPGDPNFPNPDPEKYRENIPSFVNPSTGQAQANPKYFDSSPDQLAAAYATIQRLEQEQTLVSGILSVYRDQKKAAAKAAKLAGL